MTEQLITKETFELAKLMGFDVYTCRCGGNPECIFHCNHDNLLPTQSTLQKWLREKHGLILWVEFTDKENLKWQYVIFGGEKKFIGNSYEEALEAGLKYALKLIK